jgi:pyruvate-ferredoxin/flavodoxin oxidoreductase
LRELDEIRHWLAGHADAVEADNEGHLVEETLRFVPVRHGFPVRRQWLGAWQKGTRQAVPALVDPTNPGLTGPVQNQPDSRPASPTTGRISRRGPPGIARQAMDEYSELTGRQYSPRSSPMTSMTPTTYSSGSVRSAMTSGRSLPYLRSRGIKVGLVAVKLLQPFPEAEVVAALRGKKAVTVMVRSDQMALTPVRQPGDLPGAANAAHPGRFRVLSPSPRFPR